MTSTDRSRCAWLALVLLAWLAWAPAARAETVGCTPIAALPVQITNAGRYCLEADFAQDFNNADPVLIQQSDVVLDCNGHRIRHTDPAGNGARGIHASSGLANVTIRNCVVDGFFIGIELTSDGTIDGSVRLEGNEVLNARVYGIEAAGANIRIEGNHVDHVLGDSTADGPVGILLYSGTGFDVRGNTVSDIRPAITTATGNAFGIFMQQVQDSVVADNTVIALTGYTGFGVYGIRGWDVSGISVERNVVASPPAPGTAPHDGHQYRAIFFEGTPEQLATIACRDNVVGHFDTDIQGCTAALNTEY
jgi:hypothetical protein